jgi:tetratricopeptide (TPR) repeat protein
MKTRKKSEPSFSRILIYISLLAQFALLSACVSNQSNKRVGNSEMPTFNSSLFKVKMVVDLDSITQLDETQKEAFLDFYNDPKFALTPSHLRVATYLGLLLDQFTYSEKTFTALETLENRKGNCLSVTMLTTALAELVGVELHYQLLDQNPVFSISDNLLVTSDHLRAVLKSTLEVIQGEEMGRASYIRIDYFDTNGLSFVDNISVTTQKSLFYSNLSIEHLANNDIDTAFAYAKAALDIYSKNASALNTMGILHRKRGDLATAEKLYKFGAHNYAKAPVFLRNYKNLMASQGREFDLNHFITTKQQSNQTHPWEWVRAGKAAFNSGDYNEAIAYYKKALVIAPNIPEVHAYAGQASLAAGKNTQSKKFFIEAYKLSNGGSDQQLYEGKLLALKGSLN